MKSRFFAPVLFALVLLVSLPAYALDLQSARDAGLVGEALTGYVAALKETPEVAALVKDVNTKRLAEFTKISQKNGQPVDVVAKLAAQQIIQNLSPGHYYQAADGSWKQR
ncbi:MAG: YdbL family protein [Alphaproteobacteria bacterium]|nr:YdbL family protein [Alphaproteobacteria bacterium]